MLKGREDTNKKINYRKLNPRNEDLINKKMLDEYQRKLLSRSLIDNKNRQKTRNDKKIGQMEKRFIGSMWVCLEMKNMIQTGHIRWRYMKNTIRVCCIGHMRQVLCHGMRK